MIGISLWAIVTVLFSKSLVNRYLGVTWFGLLAIRAITNKKD